MIGDQQAALFGHGCRGAGQAECTHGTATFVNVVAGNTPPDLDTLNVYHAWSLPEHAYCLEADTTVSGAAVRWMTERGHLFDSENELDALAASVPDDGGVMFVPAFTGLNVPYNDHSARATIFGLTLGTDRAHIARAFLDSLGYQLRAILETIRDQTGLRVQQTQRGRRLIEIRDGVPDSSRSARHSAGAPHRKRNDGARRGAAGRAWPGRVEES